MTTGACVVLLGHHGDVVAKREQPFEEPLGPGSESRRHLHLADHPDDDAHKVRRPTSWRHEVDDVDAAGWMVR